MTNELEWIVIGLIFAIITSLIWFFTKEYVNGVFVSISMILWGLLHLLMEPTKLNEEQKE